MRFGLFPTHRAILGHWKINKPQTNLSFCVKKETKNFLLHCKKGVCLYLLFWYHSLPCVIVIVAPRHLVGQHFYTVKGYIAICCLTVPDTGFVLFFSIQCLCGGDFLFKPKQKILVLKCINGLTHKLPCHMVVQTLPRLPHNNKILGSNLQVIWGLSVWSFCVLPARFLLFPPTSQKRAV